TVNAATTRQGELYAVIPASHYTAQLVFFFSSRRRHTRFKCDWSSDVCSSDLLAREPAGAALAGEAENRFLPIAGVDEREGRLDRSEERRVGEEWRTGGTA